MTVSLSEVLYTYRQQLSAYHLAEHVLEVSVAILSCKGRIPTDDLIPKNRRCRNQHPLASKEAYKSSFFPQTIRDWNDLPDSLISSAEMSDDCVSKFTSLVRARD